MKEPQFLGPCLNIWSQAGICDVEVVYGTYLMRLKGGDWGVCHLKWNSDTLGAPLTVCQWLSEKSRPIFEKIWLSPNLPKTILQGTVEVGHRRILKVMERQHQGVNRPTTVVTALALQMTADGQPSPPSNLSKYPSDNRALRLYS